MKTILNTYEAKMALMTKLAKVNSASSIVTDDDKWLDGKLCYNAQQPSHY
jgi:hypothetical protein